MITDHDYHDLITGAQDALEALFDASEPDAWLGLRAEYSELVTTLELIEVRERAERRGRALDQQRDRERAWQRGPAEYRERVLLEALGDRRLTVRELAHRMNAAVDEPDGRPTIYHPDVRRLADRMVIAGQLKRELESFKSRGRYRYWRRDALEGPIAGLERAYHAGERASS